MVEKFKMSTPKPIANPVATACAKSLEDFERDYMPPRSSYARYATSPASSEEPGKSYKIGLYTPKTLPPDDLTACLKLVERTSGRHYRESRQGWNVRRKRGEMGLWDLRYLVVREGGGSCHGTGPGEGEWEDLAIGEGRDGEGDVEEGAEGEGEEENESIVEDGEEGEGEIKGFMSFMPTFEDGMMVLYLYELHLVDELRGTGLGTHLMSLLASIAHAIPGVQKTMLTCFTANEAALSFYKKLGYGKDEYSPEPKRLKGGRVVESDYVILR
ncbi:hypothetical protein DSL72_000409 [Monilinia vaccinii-corymbosi]|uniref:N-alpha-acetyltransferase 40 n=1 Tax=Monilinia vaccinii-corymbosi TaxID=61207 RepID=A0A8A3P6B4_9HELO|nr:hypothetical protein DSL72_000409 [Monilinia vaccinii-corymbosi]